MLLEVKDLHFRYIGATGLALANINLNVGEGEFIAVVGSAGSGKTTLTECLNGTVPHFKDGEWAGSIRINGWLTNELSPVDLAQLVGTVSSDPDSQLVAMTVEEEVAFGLENLCLPRHEIEERLCYALEQVGAGQLRYRSTNSLSGGEKGRVALAAILALQPRILILDEPVAELDPVGADMVMSAVMELHNTIGTTVILFESRLVNVVRYATRLVLLHKGEIISDGPMRKIIAQEELLKRAGLMVPPVTKAALAYKEQGLISGVGELPLSIEELKQALAGNLNEGA
jgi:energy-coupling factor transporter ATP-binding protein EcfA2